MSLLKDLELHLLGAPLVVNLVKTRVFGTQVPDQQELPYVRIERTETEFQRFSTGKLVKSAITLTCYAATSETAEQLGKFVAKRMGITFTSAPPAKTIDVRPEDSSTEVEPERGEAGIFRYFVPLLYTVTTQEPRI